MTKHRLAAFLLTILAASSIGPARGAEPAETPSLAAAVAAGTLPKVADRLPIEPRSRDADVRGTPGGELRVLMASAKDTRMMVAFGYARLVGYDTRYELQPDILKSVEVSEGRIFTLHLRAGHKWSDGQPFTAEDFRYWFEDVANNDKLTPSGLPVTMLPQGEAPRFELVDATTIRYSWSHPNPLFLPDLAGPMPLEIFLPAHYLKQFHQKYADKKTLDAAVKSAGVRNWAALHTRLSNAYRNDNPDLPSLEPWVLKTAPPSERFVFERNPFYHHVDAAGHQLPYIDRVVMTIADSKIIPAKTGAGESDLQARYLRFDNYTFLKAGEARNGYKVRLWRTGPGSQLAIYPNLNAGDPVWRGLMRDVRFRHALSLGINRHEINQAIYFGLAVDGQDTLLPSSPLFKPEYRSAWAEYDPAEAARLLDLIGLKNKDSEGIRLLPDGRKLEIIIENAGESTEQSDVLELVRDSWRKIGIKLFSKPSQLQLFRNRVFSGEALMTIDKGLENGLATAQMPPRDIAPTSQQQLQWPRWGQYVETKGKAGEAPDQPAAIRLKNLYDSWLAAIGEDEQGRIWQEMLRIWADETYAFGTVAGVPQPVVISNRLHNVPQQAFYNWDPGAQFGMYGPETFWLDPPDAKSASLAAAPPTAK